MFIRARLGKEPTFRDTITGFPAKCRLGSACDWLCREGNLLQPNKSTT